MVALGGLGCHPQGNLDLNGAQIVGKYANLMDSHNNVAQYRIWVEMGGYAYDQELTMAYNFGEVGQYIRYTTNGNYYYTTNK